MTKHRRTEPLKVTVTGRNMPITDPLHDYATEKLGHLERYLDRVAGITVVSQPKTPGDQARDALPRPQRR